MAWPFIFKFLGLGAFLAADSAKTESARIKAQTIAPCPDLQPTRFGFPEYMRPRDLHGNKLTDEQIIENQHNAYTVIKNEENIKRYEST